MLLLLLLLLRSGLLARLSVLSRWCLPQFPHRPPPPPLLLSTAPQLHEFVVGDAVAPPTTPTPAKPGAGGGPATPAGPGGRRWKSRPGEGAGGAVEPGLVGKAPASAGKARGGKGAGSTAIDPVLNFAAGESTQRQHL